MNQPIQENKSIEEIEQQQSFLSNQLESFAKSIQEGNFSREERMMISRGIYDLQPIIEVEIEKARKSRLAEDIFEIEKLNNQRYEEGYSAGRASVLAEVQEMIKTSKQAYMVHLIEERFLKDLSTLTPPKDHE